MVGMVVVHFGSYCFPSSNSSCFCSASHSFSISASLKWLGIPLQSVQSSLIMSLFWHQSDAKCCFPGSSFSLDTSGSISTFQQMGNTNEFAACRPAHAFADACQPLIEWIDTPGRGDIGVGMNSLWWCDLMFVVHYCWRQVVSLKNHPMTGKHSRSGKASDF